MGLQLSLTCASESCLYTTVLSTGTGMYAVREPRRCARCGGFADVLVRRWDPPGDWVPASGRGRCPQCGSPALRQVTESELRSASCPCCGGALVQQPHAIWD